MTFCANVADHKVAGSFSTSMKCVLDIIALFVFGILPCVVGFVFIITYMVSKVQDYVSG